MPLELAYPLLFVFAGYLAATLLYRRALALMQADAKAALADASSSTRLLNVVVIGLFLVVLLWRAPVAWVFLGCAYVSLGIRSVFRLRRLNLPAPAARLILIGNVSGIGGIVLCAFVFALR